MLEFRQRRNRSSPNYTQIVQIPFLIFELSELDVSAVPYNLFMFFK